METRNLILILEDNEENVIAFEEAVAQLPINVATIVWKTAAKFIVEARPFFSRAALISLDHDLENVSGASDLSGTNAVDFLCTLTPFCPIIIHTSNPERRYSMANTLRDGRWRTEIVGPIGQDWIQTSWLKRVEEVLA